MQKCILFVSDISESDQFSKHIKKHHLGGASLPTGRCENFSVNLDLLC